MPNYTPTSVIEEALLKAGIKAEVVERKNGTIVIESKPTIVKYGVYAHASEERMYEAAMDAGFDNDEIQKYNLGYVGYEINGTVTVNRETGDVKVDWNE